MLRQTPKCQTKFYPDLLILFDGVSSTLPPLSCLLQLLFTVTLCLDLFAAIIFSEKLNLQLHLTRSFIWVCAIRFYWPSAFSLTSLRLNKGIVKRPSSLNQFGLFPYLSIFWLYSSSDFPSLSHHSSVLLFINNVFSFDFFWSS